MRENRKQMEQAISEADLRVLLMVLFHMTGDRKWISHPFLPKRDVRLIADESAGFDPQIQQQIRAAALDTFGRGEPTAVIDEVDEDLLVELMSVCLGEAVDPAYGPLMLEDMGFRSNETQWSEPTQQSQIVADNNVLIVGAGMGGLSLGIQFKRLGIPFTIVERNHDVGGTWLENRFPGAGVDTPNLFYSWASRPNAQWSRYFSLRDELLAYLQDAATELGIREHIQFQTSLRSASWDQVQQRWNVSLESSHGVEETSARILISAIGHISEPNQTRFEGMQDFRGPIFHSARWPEDLDLKGKRVAVVGTGATSMQMCPAVVDDVAHLTIYQRSPQWARPTPEYQRTVSPETQWLFENVPFYSRWYRFTLFWRYGDGLLRFLKKDPDWPHPERSLNRVNDRHRQQMTDHITETLDGRPDLIEKCVPSYPPYGKRILLDNGWFDMLLRDNVDLVTDAVDAVDEDGITDSAKTHREHDVIILATGFSIAKLAARLEIHGVTETLAEAWADENPTAHLGMTVPGFPNLFIGYGPNTNYGHGGSAFFNAECQTRYITETIVEMLENEITAVDVKQAAHDEWIDRVDRAHAELIWTHPGLTTWYRNKHGRVVSTSPFRLVDYWTETHQTDLHNYHQSHGRQPANGVRHR